MNQVIKIALASTLLVAGLNAGDILKGSGASFPYSVYQKWIKAYNKDTNLKIDYIKKGSSKGIKDAKARSVDFAGTDKPLSPKVLKKEGLYQFPAVVGAITMGYNVPGVENIKLSRQAIVAIADGSITYWDDALIAKQNAGVKLPHEKLTFVQQLLFHINTVQILLWYTYRAEVFQGYDGQSYLTRPLHYQSKKYSLFLLMKAMEY